jgi:hypothetical protein
MTEKSMSRWSTVLRPPSSPGACRREKMVHQFRAARSAFQGPVLAGGRSISKNLLQLIRLRPVVRVGLVHDRNASEVSESSPDKRSGTIAPNSKATFADSPASKATDFKVNQD